MRETDVAVLAAVEATLLHPEILDRALEHAEAALLRGREVESVHRLADERRELEAAIRRLAAAIANGGELLSLVEAVALVRAAAH